MVGVILKVFLLSILLALAIKYGGPWLAVPESDVAAWIGVLFPPLLLAAILGWRWWKLHTP